MVLYSVLYVQQIVLIASATALLETVTRVTSVTEFKLERRDRLVSATALPLEMRRSATRRRAMLGLAGERGPTCFNVGRVGFG